MLASPRFGQPQGPSRQNLYQSAGAAGVQGLGSGIGAARPATWAPQVSYAGQPAPVGYPAAASPRVIPGQMQAGRQAVTTSRRNLQGFNGASRRLQFDDWNRRHVQSAQPARVITTAAGARVPAHAGAKPSAVANGNKALEYCLQVLLNVQAVDPKVLSRAMQTPEDTLTTLDAAGLMRKLTEVGPSLVNAEDRLRSALRGLSMQDTVNLLMDIGLDAEGVEEVFRSDPTLADVQEEVFAALSDILPATSIENAVSILAQRRMKQHLEARGVTRWSDHILRLRHDGESWAAVWDRMYLQYPSRPPPDTYLAHRTETRVIIIGPGFGLLATPHMIDTVRRSGYQMMELTQLPNLETIYNNPPKIQAAVQDLKNAIAQFQPHVICAASKGGLYFPYLWADDNWSIPCVLINAHPSITKLSKKGTCVITQGSNDQTFKRITERQTLVIDNAQVRDSIANITKYAPLRRNGDSPGLTAGENLQIPCGLPDGRITTKDIPKGAVFKSDVSLLGKADHEYEGLAHLSSIDDMRNLQTPCAISYRHGREDLEDLIRTGSAHKCFLYLSVSGVTVRPGQPPQCTRSGDSHAAPASLCMHDCLPRLIDAAASDRPEDAFCESWPNLLDEARREGENFLGFDPESYKRFWTPDAVDAGNNFRFPVDPNSDEFIAISQIFASNPKEKAYNFNHSWNKQILNIDRVQNPGMVDNSDAYYVGVQHSIEQQGSRFINGVHTRWLFHGSPAIDSIISDHLQGFKVTLSNAKMWGTGIYFARDAQYPDDHGFFGKPRADGSKDMILCLVTTGTSILGDEAYAIPPYRPGTNYRYHSYVDDMSNPEIFVVNSASAVFPAYVITYRDAEQ